MRMGTEGEAQMRQVVGRQYPAGGNQCQRTEAGVPHGLARNAECVKHSAVRAQYVREQVLLQRARRSAARQCGR